MSSRFTDFKVGFRQIAKHPGDMALAALAYAVGLGLVGLMLTLLFGVVRAHPDNIDFDAIQILNWDESTSHLWKSGAQTTQMRLRDYRDIEESQDSFKSFAAFRGATFNVAIDQHAERVDGLYVTAQYFDVYDLAPRFGRFFAEGDDAPGAERRIVIGHELWSGQLESDADIVGKSLLVNGLPATVIGVAPEGYDFPVDIEIWMNDTTNPLDVKRGEGDIYTVLGQLLPGESAASAQTSLNTIARRLEAAYPETNTGYIALKLQPLASMFNGGNFNVMVYLMLACASLVLLIACTNVANLNLSRATERVKELAIRSSLGGARGRLIWQMIIEGLAVAVLGGVGGIIIAIWTSKAIWAWVTQGDTNQIPSWMNMDVDIQVVAALSVATLIASVVANIIPAIQASRADVNEILKDQSRGSSGLRIGKFSKFLAFFQLSVSCGLLIATSALVSTANETEKFDPPYDPTGMMVARFDLPEERYPDSSRAETLRQLQQRLESNEALEGVGFTSAIDMLFNWQTRWVIQGQESADPDDYIPARHEVVSDNYFELLGVPLLEGRGFESADAGENAQQVCVINEVMAKRVWPGESAIGRQIRDAWNDTNPWVTIVGVVPDTSMAGPGPRTDEQRAGVYRPMSNTPQSSVTVFARALGDPLAQARAIREALSEMDDSLALYRVKTVEKAVEESNFGWLFFRNMFGLFGIAAVALASIGVYGVMNFSVRQRFQEFGIRQALGAPEGAIARIVARMGGIQIALGIGAGILLGKLLVGLISQNTGNGVVVEASNYLIPILTLFAVTAVALYVPTRYVTTVNLAKCLRDE